MHIHGADPKLIRKNYSTSNGNHGFYFENIHGTKIVRNSSIGNGTIVN